MRTHFYRRKVDEKTLLFGEMESVTSEENQQQHEADVERTSSHIASQSINFLENFADITMMQLSTHGMIQGRGTCEPATLDNTMDDRSQSSGSSGSRQFGTTLSSHLSPESGHKVRRPMISVPPGLIHPDETEAAMFLTAPPLPDFSVTKEGGIPYKARDARVLDEDETHVRSCETPPSSSSSGSPQSEGDDQSVVASLTMRASLEDSGGPRALFDVDDDDDEGSPCPASPSVLPASSPSRDLHHFDIPMSTPQFAKSLILTPKEEPHYHQRASEFVTPARLRDIRGRGSNVERGNYKSTCEKKRLSTPEATKIPFEPSSIIDNGEPDNALEDRLSVSPLHKEEAIFLALPEIQNVSNEKYAIRNRRFGENLLKRKLRYPVRRSPPEIESPASFVSSRLNMYSSIVEQDNPAETDSPDDLSLEKTATVSCRTLIGGQDRSPRKDAVWFSKERPISPRTVHLHEVDAYKVGEHWQDDTSTHCGSHDSQDPPSSSEKRKPGCKEELNDLHGPVEEHKECDNESAMNQKPTFLWSANKKLGDANIVVAHVPSTTESCPEPFELIKADQTDLVDTPSELPCNRECMTHEAPAPSDGGGERNILLHTVSLGGILSTDTPGLKRTMSWPDASGAFQPAMNRMNDLSEPERQEIVNLGPEVVCNSFTSAGRRIILAGSQTMCHSFPSTDESFQAAVEGMMARLSPSPSPRPKDSHFADSENNEFLNNYFYCVKPEKAKKLAEERRHTQRAVCTEPGYGNDAFCHDIGVDTVCNGFTFLFSSDRATPVVSKPQTERKRSLSLGRDSDFELKPSGWLGMFEMASNRFRFGFKNTPRNERAPFHFQPPCLKKACSIAPAKTRHRKMLILSPSDKNAFEAVVEMQRPSYASLSDSRFQSIFGVSREGFLSLSKADRRRLVEKSAEK
jgi:hypothetical protein